MSSCLQANLGNVAGTDLPHESNIKPGELQKEDAECDMGQMLPQYGIVITDKLASHESWIKTIKGVEHSLHYVRNTDAVLKVLIVDKCGAHVL